MAIIFAGILIAGAVIYTGKGESESVNKAPTDQVSASLKKVDKVSDKDYIRGDRNAKILIIEYSDTECPYCKQFHLSMKQIFDEYGPSGKVAWIYRHFPLDQIHSKARAEATALECAGELGGNDKFWQYTDRIYEITPSNDGLDLAELPKIAEYVGLDVVKFKECLSSDKYREKIESQFQNAVATGGRGTPWSVVVYDKGKKQEAIPGAYPYEALKQMIEDLLNK